MAMQALETERMFNVSMCRTVRQSDIFKAAEPNPTTSFFNLDDEMDILFMDTFDQSHTQAEGETFDVWCQRFKVEQRHVSDQEYLVISFIGLSPFLRDPYNKGDLVEATYLAGCITHGDEESYLNFLYFLFSGTTTL